VLRNRIRAAMGRPLSDAEREVFAALAIDWLAQMSRGEISGYDVRPAEDAIYKALRSNQVGMSSLAIEMVGRLPGATAQRELAAIVLDPTRDKLRSAAAFQLSRHIQQNSLALDKVQVKRLKELFATTQDKKLKGNLALVIGSMRPSRTVTGNRLKDYQPT